MLRIAEPLAEPIAIEDTYVDRLCAIENTGDGDIRFVFGVNKKSSYDGSPEVVVRSCLVAGPTLIWHTIRMTMEHLGRRCCGAVIGRDMRH